MIEAQVWQRVVRFVGESGRPGTACLIDLDGVEFLLTAKHLCIDEPEEFVSIVHGLSDPTGPQSLLAERVGDRHGEPDIALFRLPERLVPEGLPLPVKSDGMIYGQEAYILGYPFGLTFGTGPSGGDQLPLVKAGVIAGSAKDGEVRVHYLDVMANPGFSGGPMIVTPPGGRPQLAGVVRGQFLGPLDEPSEANPSPTRVPSGISVVTDAGEVLKLLGN